ncbi:hypothetical protein Tdes44962_MAKER09851 [Teratosphaeria destructans]|uniref:Uncharacterized protein n=1 Tax=Teratosphaeria destructans TaxID=418781 RepID=A0A9W7SR35_9PEZI|nr:hypothetical protein Tdes44962_MAKER09851 [Teratosphaeria destructans]
MTSHIPLGPPSEMPLAASPKHALSRSIDEVMRTSPATARKSATEPGQNDENRNEAQKKAARREVAAFALTVDVYENHRPKRPGEVGWW